MKRIIFISFILLFLFSAEGQDVFFKKAIKEGYKNRGYQFEVPQNTVLSEEAIRSYAEKHNYEIVSLQIRNQPQKGVSNVVFLEKDPTSILYFIAYSFNKNLNQNNYTNSGAVYVPEDSYWSKPENAYWNLITIGWSGSLANSRIDGQGCGIINRNDNVIYIEGIFREGVPSGKVTIKTGNLYSLMKNPSACQTVVVNVYASDNQGVWIKKDNLYYYLRNDGFCIGGFESIIQTFSLDGKAVVMRNQKEYNIDRSGVMRITERQKEKDQEEEQNESWQDLNLIGDQNLQEQNNLAKQKCQEEELKRQEEARLAEKKRQEEERLAEQKRQEEEKKRLEEKIRKQQEREKLIVANSDVNKWDLGNKLCNCGQNHIMVALDSWNEGRTAFKGQILTSDIPKYETQIMKKGNILWFETKNWHKCLEDEIAYCSVYDISAIIDEKGDFPPPPSRLNKGDRITREIIWTEKVGDWLFGYREQERTCRVWADVEDISTDGKRIKIKIITNGGYWCEKCGYYQGKVMWEDAGDWKTNYEYVKGIYKSLE